MVIRQQFVHRISEYYKGFTPEREPKKAPARLGGASGLIWGATLAHLGATLAHLGATLVHLDAILAHLGLDPSVCAYASRLRVRRAERRVRFA